MRKNLIIVGNQIKPDWEFRKGLEDGSNEPWINRSCTTNRFNGINKFTRYIKYFTISFSVILNRKKYKTIVTWDQFFGLILAFYARLFRLKDLPHIYPMAFIYRPKKGFVGKIYRRFVEYAITSGKITNVILFSDSEAQYYAELFGVDESLFIPETLGVEDRSKEFAQTEKPDTYVAAGRSNRDYDFLRDSWREMDKHLDIICDTENRPNTNNISHLTDCHGDKYLQKIADARVVIVPLSDEKVSSGQLVFEHAAMFGKPVIVTRNKTLNRYIEDDITGLIMRRINHGCCRYGHSSVYCL